MLFLNANGEDPEELKKQLDELRRRIGPLGLNRMLRGVVNVCWMMLPAEKQTRDGLTEEMREAVERVLETIPESMEILPFMGDE